MSTATSGSFIWFDLLTTDPAAAVSFYSHVIGWKTQAMTGSTYTMFLDEDGPLAGTDFLPETAKQLGAPAHWAANVQVADVDATAKEAKRLGGRIIAEPADYGVGRLAVIADPHGAPTINVFTPKRPVPARDQLKPGEFVWCELVSANHEASFAFYSQLFGWRKSSDFDMGPMGTYLLFNNGGRDLGGMFTKPSEIPVPFWMYYLQVVDLDTALERAQQNGARVLNGPMPVPGGARIVQLADPQGALISLHEEAKR